MPSKPRPKGLFSPQESDYLQRYGVRLDGAIVQNEPSDASVKKDVEQKARDVVSSSLYEVLLESVLLRSFLGQEAPREAIDISLDVGGFEKDDKLVSEFVKAWVPEDRFKLFLNNLLLFDARYPVADRAARWSMILRALRRDVRNVPDTDIARADRNRVLRSLSDLEQEVAWLSVGPNDGDGARTSGERIAQSGQSPRARDHDVKAAQHWLMDGGKGKHLTIDLPVRVKERPGVQFTMRWDYNIPALLLTTLTWGFPCDYEAPSIPLTQATWPTITDLIIERFKEYDLAVIVETRCSGHPTLYYFDPLNVPKKDELGDLLSSSDREEEARRMWKERFTGFRYAEVVSVQDVSDIVKKIETTIDRSKESGGKKSVLTSAINHMKALGLVEGVPEARRGMVRITDLGRRMANYIDLNEIDDVDAIALRGRQIFLRKARSRSQRPEELGKAC